MHRLAILCLLLTAAPALAGGSGAASLCAADEKIWLNAAVAGSDRLVSLCGAKDLAAKGAWLQYREGRPDAVALRFPAKRRGSLKTFTYRRYTRPRFTLLKLEFTRNGRRYVIEEGDSPDEKPNASMSLRVGGPDAPSVELIPTTPALNMMRLEYKVRTRPWYK